MITHSKQRIVILGGGYAGMLAASRLARDERTAVTVIDQKPIFVQRIRLHELLGGNPIAKLDYAPMLARRGIGFIQARAEGIDTNQQKLWLTMQDGTAQECSYDVLLIALGSSTGAPIPGVAEHALRLNDHREIENASRQLRALAARNGRVLVVGSGSTAIETTGELATSMPGLRVTLATRGRVGQEFSSQAAAYLRHTLQGFGVELLDHTSITALEANQAVLADGRSLPFEQCVWAAGFVAPSLLRQAGFATDSQGRALVTPTLQVLGQPNIFVAGDSASFGDTRAIRMGCVSAMPMGAHASRNVLSLISGQAPQAFDFGLISQNMSLGRNQAVVQFVDRSGTPVERILTNRSAAIVKELVCRMTLESIRGEMHTGLPLFVWANGGHWFERSAYAHQI